MPAQSSLPTTSDQCRALRRRANRWPQAQPPVGEGLRRLSVVRPVAKTALLAGTVVWAHVPYEDIDASKLRPAVVASVSGRDVTIYPATTSEARRRYRWDHHELVNVASAGLHCATGLRLSPVTVDTIDIVSVAGALGPEDHRAVFPTSADLRDDFAQAA